MDMQALPLSFYMMGFDFYVSHVKLMDGEEWIRLCATVNPFLI